MLQTMFVECAAQKELYNSVLFIYHIFDCKHFSKHHSQCKENSAAAVAVWSVVVVAVWFGHWFTVVSTVITNGCKYH